MGQDEIFTILLVILLLANEDASSERINEIVILGLLLGFRQNNTCNRTDTVETRSSFPR